MTTSLDLQPLTNSAEVLEISGEKRLMVPSEKTWSHPGHSAMIDMLQRF